ncbi:MAG: methyltransferase domain-containing protein [Defluviitaleaceae bacterium]|nr:methyltransferase domain-containing protein [Defluviitaleaceae bacterium]
MGKLSFIWQYITKPRTTGAILPSSVYLARKMVAGINFENARVIVEYGPGTGVFTEKLIGGIKGNTLLVLIERNEDFCRMLEKKYAGKANLYVINGSAEDTGKYLTEHGADGADYIVSGLPFASLPPQVSQEILAQTKKHLKPGGKFITFQYTLFKKKIFSQYFNKIEITREFRNVPPAYVLACSCVPSREKAK